MMETNGFEWSFASQHGYLTKNYCIGLRDISVNLELVCPYHKLGVYLVKYGHKPTILW